MSTPLTTFLISTMLAITSVSVTSNTSQAKVSASTTRINGEGFRKCKAQGNSGYTAIVRGTSISRSGGDGGLGKFRIRSCFQTKAQCSHFVNRVPHVVLGVIDISYASCKSRG